MIKRNLHHIGHFVSLYITLVIVGTIVIFLMAHVPLTEALATAAVGCLAKTIAVKVHDYIWRMFHRPKAEPVMNAAIEEFIDYAQYAEFEES